MHESRPPIEIQDVEVSCAVQLHYFADVDVASTRTRHAMMHLIKQRIRHCSSGSVGWRHDGRQILRKRMRLCVAVTIIWRT